MKIVNLTVVILNSISAMKWTANKEEANKFLQTRWFVFSGQYNGKNRSKALVKYKFSSKLFGDDFGMSLVTFPSESFDG